VASLYLVQPLQVPAGDRGLTVTKALQLIDNDQLNLNRRTVAVVDEAATFEIRQLRRLLEASTSARAMHAMRSP
jgi:hypothetical protein